MRVIPNSLSPQGQQIKQCNSVALFDEGRRYYGKPGSFDVLQRSVRSLGRSFEFSSRHDGGKLVGQVAYYHFSIRRTRGRCVLSRPSVRACETLLCRRVHSVLVPLALDKGIGDVRGCSL